MAKTTNTNIFVITPRTAKSAITRRDNKTRQPAWYLNGLQRPQLHSLRAVGSVESFTTKNGRTVIVAAVDDVTPGTAYELTLPSGTKESVIVNPDAL